MSFKAKPRIVEIKKGERIVILTEKEYERMLDALDVAEAEMILANNKDTLLSLDEAEKRLFKRAAKTNKKGSSAKH